MLRQYLVQYFCLFSPSFIVVLVMSLVTDSEWGCQIMFSQSFQDVKSEGFREKWHSCFMSEKEKHDKRRIAKMPRRLCLWSGWENGFFKSGSLRRLQNRICVWKVEEGHFRQHYLVWESCPSLLLAQNTENTTKIGVSAGTWENPKNNFCGEKGVFG